jgi:predicted MFS family arabinose efflux permease
VYALSASTNLGLLAAGLFFFGVAFIFLQSTLVASAQAALPAMKGTAMSMASFNMFVGGAVGTSVNAKIISAYGISKIYLFAAALLLIIGIAASVILREKKGEVRPGGGMPVKP